MQLNAFCCKDMWALSTYTSNNLLREKPFSVCAQNNQNYSTPNSEDRQELFKLKSELPYNIHHGYIS